MKDDRIVKYLKMFPGDTSFNDTVAAFESGDWENAFKASHTLKGVCANLGLENLREKASELCETVRPGNDGESKVYHPPVCDVTGMIDDLKSHYDSAIKAISEIEQ